MKKGILVAMMTVTSFIFISTGCFDQNVGPGINPGPTILWRLDHENNTVLLTKGDDEFSYADSQTHANILIVNGSTMYYLDSTLSLTTTENGLTIKKISTNDLWKGFTDNITYTIRWEPDAIALGTITFH
jgi:hypothetical protein